MAAYDPISSANICSTRFCKTCGIELSLENARENRKGSGSLRPKCRSCEREEDRARHADKYVKKHKRLISRGTWFVERPNRVGMAAQCPKAFSVGTKTIDHEINDIETASIGNKHIMIFYDDICDECGGIRRYDTHLERVCEDCGLVGQPTIYNQPSSELAGRQLERSEKSRYKLRIIVNRDKEIDIQNSLDNSIVQDRYLSVIPAGAFDPSYAAWYSGIAA